MGKPSNENFYKRLQDLTFYKDESARKVNESVNGIGDLIEYVRTNDGAAYGIVKENHNYYIKKSVTKSDSIDAADFGFIGGKENSRRYLYKGLAEAQKNLKFVTANINEAFSTGGVYHKLDESVLSEAPKLDVKESADDVIKRVIQSGKKKLRENSEVKFKKEHQALWEGDLSTADSHITDADRLDNKTEAERGESAAINQDGEGNQIAADKNNATDKDGLKKEGGADSIAVNQAEEHLTEDADMGDPFIEMIKNSTKDLSTDDSDQSDADRVDNKKDVEKEEAPYNNHNQPEKGHKEEKGEELKPVASKKDIVAESNDLSTADSEQGKSIDAEESNITYDAGKLEKGTSFNMDDNAIAEDVDVDAEEQEESDPFDDKEEAGDEKNDIVAEEEIEEDDEAKAEIDAAAKALDDLDVKIDSEEEPEAPAEEPVPEEGPKDDAPAEEPAPDMDIDLDLGDGGDEEDSEDEGSEEESDDDDSDSDGDDDSDSDGDDEDERIKSVIDKYIGKIGQEARDADFESMDVKRYVNSITSAFEDDIAEMPVEDRKQMADKILKTVKDDEEEGESVASEMPKKAEKAIDSEIENLEDKQEEGVVKESDCSECGTFEQYVESRGYTKEEMMEASPMEKANIISGYAHAYGEGMNDGDYEGVAPFVDDAVLQEMEEYGQGGYMKEMQEAGVKFGVHEPMIDPTMDEGKGKFEQKFNQLLKQMGADDLGDLDQMEKAEFFNKLDKMHTSKAELQDEGEEGIKMGGAQTLGAGVVKPESAPMKFEEISESEKNIRKYIRNRLEELAGKKKPSVNESNKPEKLKKLDTLIESQWKAFGNALIDQLDGE
jgi:hypothetical protein